MQIKHCGFPTDGMIPFLGFGSRLSALSCRPSLGRSARFLYGLYPMIDHQTVSPMFCPTCRHARTPDAKTCEKCKERLQVSFRRGLALPPTFDVSSAESSAMRQWDSVAHLQLVVAIEDEFGIELGPADVVDLKSFASAVTILQRHGAWI